MAFVKLPKKDKNLTLEQKNDLLRVLETKTVKTDAVTGHADTPAVPTEKSTEKKKSPATYQVSTYLTLEEWKAVKKHCANSDSKVSAFLRHLVRDFLRQ